MKQTDVGIFLHRTAYAESSLIVLYYTFEHGLQSFAYQGAKKKKTPLFPLGIHELTYYKRPDSELGKISQIQLTYPFQEIATNPVKSMIAYFIAEVIKKTLKTDQKEVAIFQFLKQFIIDLEQAEQVGKLPSIFLISFTLHLGIQPNQVDDQALYFNLNEGEIGAHQNPYDLIESGMPVQFIAEILASNHSQIILSSEDQKRMFELLIKYYEIHLPNCNLSQSVQLIRDFLYA